jgi:formamidopyrimidine-DNA glycosylase
MGLLTGLLTLPLAPIRGTIWIAEQIAEQAALELDDERVIRRQLAEVELRYELGELTVEELDRLRRALRAATRDAIRLGGVHTGRFVPHRHRGAACPRCGTSLERATIGGRTTYWCPRCQPE